MQTVHCVGRELTEWKKKTYFSLLLPTSNTNLLPLGESIIFLGTVTQHKSSLSLVAQEAVPVQSLQGLLGFNYQNCKRISEGKPFTRQCWCCFRPQCPAAWAGADPRSSPPQPWLLPFSSSVHTRLPWILSGFFGGSGARGQEWKGRPCLAGTNKIWQQCPMGLADAQWEVFSGGSQKSPHKGSGGYSFLN